MSQVQKGWGRILDQTLEKMREQPPNLGLIARIERKVEKVLKEKYSKYPTATLVVWGLRLFDYAYSVPTTPNIHLIGFLGSEAMINALKYGQQVDLGPNRLGKFDRCLTEASNDHSDILFPTILKLKIKWILDRSTMVSSDDAVYAKKMKAISESIRNAKQRWKEVDPLLTGGDTGVRRFLFADENTRCQKHISLAKKTIDPIWAKTYGFRFSSLIHVLVSIQQVGDEHLAKTGSDVYVGRIEGLALKKIVALPETEVEKILDFVSWTKAKIVELEKMNLNPAKYLMSCALIKYADEDRYLTSNHLAFWALEHYLQAPKYDSRLEQSAKELALTNRLNDWRKMSENEVLNAFKKLFQETGLKEVHIGLNLPISGEADLAGLYEYKKRNYGVICELKEPKPGGWTTSDYARRMFFVEENPVAQLEKKIKILVHSEKDRLALSNSFGLKEFPRAIIPVVILAGQPLPYFDIIPQITIYDSPSTIQEKLNRYLVLLKQSSESQH